MVKRRRGSTDGPPSSRHRPFEELVGWALDADPRAVRGRSRRGRDRHRRRADRRPAARERDRARRDAVRPVRGRAADRMGRRLGCRSRTGSRSSGCRSRRTSPIPTTSPTRSGSRSSTSSPTTSGSTTTGSTSSASTERRRLAGADARDERDQAEHARRTNAGQHRPRQPAEPPPARARDQRVAVAAGPHVVETERRPRQADEHDDLRRDRDRQRRVDERPEREDPDDDADRTMRISPAGPDSVPRPSASNTRSAMSRPAHRPRSTSRTAIDLEDRDQGRRSLACPEDPERPSGRLERRDVAEDDPRQHVRQRRADQRRGERRGHDREVGLRAEAALEARRSTRPARRRPGSRR